MTHQTSVFDPTTRRTLRTSPVRSLVPLITPGEAAGKRRRGKADKLILNIPVVVTANLETVGKEEEFINFFH